MDLGPSTGSSYNEDSLKKFIFVFNLLSLVACTTTEMSAVPDAVAVAGMIATGGGTAAGGGGSMITVNGRIISPLECIVPFANLYIEILGPHPKELRIGGAKPDHAGAFHFVGAANEGDYRVNLRNQRQNLVISSTVISNTHTKDRFYLTLSTCPKNLSD